MSSFEWKPELSVGIASIDAQHQKLVKMVQELQTAMISGKGNEVLGKTLDGLIAYAAEHFATEERYFAAHKYPQADAHKKEHEALVSKVLSLQSDFKAGKATITGQTMMFLTEWLIKHIKGSDKQYSAFLTKAGVK
jgi:hemerythrin